MKPGGIETKYRRNAPSSKFTRRLRLLPQAFLLFFCAITMSPRTALSYLPYPVSFVGNTVVDLKWSAGNCQEYRVLRDNAVIGTIPCGQEPWFRDEGVAQGESHTYRVSYRAEDGSELREEGPATITTGNVEGRLYQSLSFDSGTYTLTGTVYVHQGATLTVAPGVTAQEAEGSYSSGIESAGNAEGQHEHPGGPIRITGATVQGLSITFSSATDNTCSGTTFTDATLNVVAPGSLTIDQNNTFQDSNIGLTDAAQATITGNEFRGLSFVRIGGAAGETTVQQNRFYTGAQNAYRSTIWVSEGYAAITQNLLEGQDDARAFGEGILVGLADASPPNVTITENIIKGYAEGIRVNDNHGQVTLTGNTLTGNGTAVTALGTTTVAMHNNCLAGNANNGLYVGPYQSVDATNNWWGSDTGPRHTANPGGSGDFVTGGGVTFFPWLFASNCRTEIPQPPGSNGQPPAISLSPNDYPAFQLDVVRGRGFDLLVRDEDGVQATDGTWKIDWSKFRVRVDGNDKTGPFLEGLIASSIANTDPTKVPVSAFLAEDKKQLRLHFEPDPKQFMGSHNLFGVEENGEAFLQLEICDTDGNCASSENWIYFGPMVFVRGPVEIIREGGLIVKNLVVANSGFDSQAMALYCVIHNLQTNTFKSFATNEDGDDEEWGYGVYPVYVFKEGVFTQGLYREVSELNLNYDGLTRSDQDVTLRFYAGIQDQVSGAFKIDWVDFTIPTDNFFLPGW